MQYRDTGRNSGNKNKHKIDRNRRPAFFKSSNRKRTSRPKKPQQIDISLFIRKSANAIAEEPIEIKNSFSDFRLCRELKSNLEKRGFVAPAPIQDQAIEHIIDGKDLIGLANTGTGKTAAFLLPLINKVYRDRSQKVLIITPTRELALQIENELRLFSWGMKIFFVSCVGGLSVTNQVASLRRSPHFVIGTPGRLKDLSERRAVRLKSFNNVVIDEVDRMLDMGFIDDITAFLNQLPAERQSLMFSATIPLKIKNLVGSFLNDPITIDVKLGETASNIDQDIVKVESNQKFEKLQEMLSEPELSKVLIFNDTKWATEKLAVNLARKGFRTESIHGDKSQSQRQKALASFKNNTVDILVATDVAARGLDIKDVTHVINYTMPQTYDDYIHRIGRTGRRSSKGTALTFVETR